MAEQADPVGRIQSLAARYAENEQNLRKIVGAPSDRLVEACKGLRLYAGSTTCTLEQTSPDAEVYGYLCFDVENGIQIASRCSDEEPDPSLGVAFRVITVEDCELEWLRSLASSGKFPELVRNLETQLSRSASEMEEQAKTISNLVCEPFSEISTGFEKIAQELGYHRALTEWRDAQRGIHINPEDAITSACALVETVCKHVLHDKGVELPSDLSIQSLWKTASKALGLDPAEQAESELRGMCGGLFTVAQNLGSLRSKFGDAHGKSPEQATLGSPYARLAVNAAGSAATFIMERWQAERSKPGAVRASPAEQPERETS